MLSDKFMLCGSMSPWHGASLDCRRGDHLHIWRVAANILNKQLQMYIIITITLKNNTQKSQVMHIYSIMTCSFVQKTSSVVAE
jgi:hypothetical protein